MRKIGTTGRAGTPDVQHTLNQQGGKGGLSCPECGDHIEITLDDLIVKRRFECKNAGCETVLRLDQRRSGDALDSARKLRDRMRETGLDPS